MYSEKNKAIDRIKTEITNFPLLLKLNIFILGNLKDLNGLGNFRENFISFYLLFLKLLLFLTLGTTVSFFNNAAASFFSRFKSVAANTRTSLGI